MIRNTPKTNAVNPQPTTNLILKSLIWFLGQDCRNRLGLTSHSGWWLCLAQQVTNYIGLKKGLAFTEVIKPQSGLYHFRRWGTRMTECLAIQHKFGFPLICYFAVFQGWW